MKDHSFNIIIRRSLLTLGLAVVGGAAWAIDVATAEKLKTALAGEETEITLTRAITLDETLTINHNVTIDLNGYNVTANNVRAFHITAGTVNITSTIPARIFAGGTIADNSSVIRVGNNGDGEKVSVSLTLGEKVEVFSNVCYGVTVFGNQTIETLVVNGTIHTDNVPAISGNGSAGYEGTTITIGEHATITTDNDVAIYHPQDGKLTVNGTVTGAGGIEMKGGQLVVGPNAKITATASPSHTENNDGCSTKGYAIAIVENGQYAGVSTVNISKDATIEGPVAVVKDSDKKDGVSDPTFDPAGLQMNVKVKDNSTSKVLGQFLTLEDAMREVPASGSTIQLFADQTLTNTLKTSNSYTLDLNGHTVTATNVRALHITAGDVTITSTSRARIYADGTIDEDSSVIRLGDNSGDAREARLTIGTNVTVKAETCYGITVFGNKTTETLTVNGKVKTINYPAIGGNGSAGYGGTTITISEGAEVTSEQELAIYHPQDGTLTVNGTVSGAGGIEMKGGRLTVGANATISATGTPTHNPDSGGSSTLGYAIAIVENGGGYAGVSEVTVRDGATINGIVAELQDSPIAGGFTPTYTGNAVGQKVAAVGKNEYFKFEDAITIVPATGTVSLLDNMTFNSTFSLEAEKTYTLDLAGHTLTGNGCAALQIAAGHVTLSNSGTDAEKTADSVAPKFITVSGSSSPAAAIILGSDAGTTRSVSLNIDKNVIVDGGTLGNAILIQGTQTRETLTVAGTVQATGHSAIATADACDQIHITNTGVVTAIDAVVIYQHSTGNLLVEGTVEGTGTTAGAIEMKGGDLTVKTGATVTAIGTPTHTPADNAPSTNGYAIAIVERSGFPGVGKVDIDKTATIMGVIAYLIDSKNSHVADPRFTGDIQLVAETTNPSSLSKRYTTIADAINAAITSGVVSLLDDMTVSESFTINKDITLNMNDYTVTGSQSSGAAMSINAAVAVTLQNGILVSAFDGISVSAGTVTLQDVTVKTTGTSLIVSGGSVSDNTGTSYTSTRHNTIALSSGTFELNGNVYNTSSDATNKHAIAATGTADLTVATTSTISSANGNGIDWQSTGTLTVNGGKISGAEAVHASAGTITIDGGTFTGTGHAVEIANGNPVVNHGTFICGASDDDKPITAVSATGFVHGDYFSKSIAQTLCAEGYIVSTHPKNNGLFYLIDELVINDGTAWTVPSPSYIIHKATYVRNSGMGAAGTKFGTLCLPFSYSATQTGMTFYNVESISNNVLNLTQINADNTITAGTPVVFQFTNPTTSFTIESVNATVSATGATTANYLVGTFTKQEITSNLSSCYFLNGDAFHQASQSLTVPAYRAYIKISPSSSNQRVLYIHTDDEETAVDAVFNEDAEPCIYDLEGRRHNTLQQGVNVVRTQDGRTIKVMVR